MDVVQECAADQGSDQNPHEVTGGQDAQSRAMIRVGWV